jgi:hypothetical protein
MSVYAVNKLCRDALHDLAFREALKRDPKGAIAARDLTDDERKALLDGDVARLAALGNLRPHRAHLQRAHPQGA